MGARPVLAAVTSSNRPYLYDAPNVMSMPMGTEFRFRYRDQWVEESLRQLASASPDELKGSRVILVFHCEQTGCLVPLREATVVRVDVLGPITYVRFRVGGFFNAPEVSATGGETPLVRATETGRRLLGLGQETGLKQRLPKEHYFRRVQSQADLRICSLGTADAWWGIVSLLGSVPTLRELPFFHVLGLASEDGQQRAWTWLSQGGRYRLRILEWSFNDKDEPLALVNCSCSPDLLVLEAASNLIVGRYDVVDFDFVATKLGKGQLEIALTKTREDGSHPRDATNQSAKMWDQSFHTVVPVRVIPSWWRTLARFTVALLGAILYVWMGPVVAEEWSPRAQDAIQVIGLLLFVVSMGSLGEKAVSAGKDVRDLAREPVRPGQQPT